VTHDQGCVLLRARQAFSGLQGFPHYLREHAGVGKRGGGIFFLVELGRREILAPIEGQPRSLLRERDVLTMSSSWASISRGSAALFSSRTGLTSCTLGTSMRQALSRALRVISTIS
jgi:hypothetical protein